MVIPSPTQSVDLGQHHVLGVRLGLLHHLFRVGTRWIDSRGMLLRRRVPQAGQDMGRGGVFFGRILSNSDVKVRLSRTGGLVRCWILLQLHV